MEAFPDHWTGLGPVLDTPLSFLIIVSYLLSAFLAQTVSSK